MILQTKTIRVPKHIEDDFVDQYINRELTEFVAGATRFSRGYAQVSRADRVSLHPFTPRHVLVVYQADKGYKDDGKLTAINPVKDAGLGKALPSKERAGQDRREVSNGSVQG
jgi:hypothetical protein